MSSTSENYPGQNALISYIAEKNRMTKKSYWGFLNNHRNIIITSIITSSTFSDNWNKLDNLWASRFLHEVPDLKEKVILERIRYTKTLKVFWQEIIKEYKEKKNLTPASNINLTDFCHDILQELDDKSNIHSFYEYDEKEVSDKNIKNPMDLFTINSKLENNQYTSTGEFEKDIRLIFRNCYTYNDIGSEIYTLGEKLELAFNKIWTEKIVFQVKQKKEKLKRIRDSDTDDEIVIKQIRILEQNKDKLVYRQVINDALLIASAYENLVIGNIIPFTELLKTFLSTRSQISLSSADEPVLQAIVENLLPLKYRIPELSLVVDGTKLKGFGRFGYSDILILKGIGNNNISLELKYISLVGLIKIQKNKFNANDLENLDKIIEKEDEKILLKRLYTYWSKEHKETKQTTIEEVLDNGINQLELYMNIISKGKTSDYYSSGIFDKRIKITKSDSPNKLKGFVILVIGFHRVLWRSVEEIMSNYSYEKI
ncbi:unnamed protein product [Rhizophagus irregularis]|uniref:Bromo domain-containing protein n=1 Tax=Rhizophagus irregularis TaxID=588596 RepID=A0A915Z0L3_9GLOM|nr:unnamed protein product [Rhizophagus irregularis]CAB5357589.1 unnamed protein product [Rhizophagus irregularis]